MIALATSTSCWSATPIVLTTRSGFTVLTHAKFGENGCDPSSRVSPTHKAKSRRLRAEKDVLNNRQRRNELELLRDD